MTMTPDDVIKAAASVARDAAQGRLDPTDLEAAAVQEYRTLLGSVTGPDDSPLWALQVEVCRAVLAAGGIPPEELSEHLAVARRCAAAAPTDALD